MKTDVIQKTIFLKLNFYTNNLLFTINIIIATLLLFYCFLVYYHSLYCHSPRSLIDRTALLRTALPRLSDNLRTIKLNRWPVLTIFLTTKSRNKQASINLLISNNSSTNLAGLRTRLHRELHCWKYHWNMTIKQKLK